MHVERHAVDFDLVSFVQRELPFMGAFYTDGATLRQDIQDLFAFPVAQRDALPFYRLSEAGAQRIATGLDDTYAMMIAALRRVLADPQALATWFDGDLMRRHGETFVDYARHTFEARGMVGQSLYGRFDAAVDPVTETLRGIYEFNGDTPVMLCESVNLQHWLTQQVTGSAEPQWNSWYPEVSRMLAAHGLKREQRYAVVCDTRAVEDMATCETLAQCLDEHVTCYLLDLAELDYDHLQVDKPFIARPTGEPLDGIFVLSPWEEMVANFPLAFAQWRHWARHVALLEPPWRWFLSHKGMLAYVTWLRETDTAFAQRWQHVPWLATYLTPEPFQAAGQPYVAKPVLGRLSANIRVVDAQGVTTHQTPGPYGDVPQVYQAWCAPGRVEGRHNFVLGAWMATAPHARLAQAQTLCFREFDAAVLDLANERFIPHLLALDGAG